MSILELKDTLISYLPSKLTSVPHEQTIAKFVVNKLGTPLLVIGSSLPLLSAHFYPKELPFKASLALSGACLLGAVAVQFSYETVVSYNKGQSPDLNLYLCAARKLFYQAAKYFHLVNGSILFLSVLQEANLIEPLVKSSREVCAISLVAGLSLLAIVSALKYYFPKHPNSSDGTPHVEKPILFRVGVIFAQIAGSLPIISASYLSLPLSFSFSLLLSGACLAISTLAFWIAMQSFNPPQTKSSFLLLASCAQHSFYCSLKAFSQFGAMAMSHELAQRCLTLTPFIIELSAATGMVAFVALLSIDILILGSLRLSTDQMKESGFFDFKHVKPTSVV